MERDDSVPMNCSCGRVLVPFWQITVWLSDRVFTLEPGGGDRVGHNFEDAVKGPAAYQKWLREEAALEALRLTRGQVPDENVFRVWEGESLNVKPTPDAMQRKPF